MRKTVLVTGSSRGIGASIIKKFAMNNFDVIINYLNCENEALTLKKKLLQNIMLNVKLLSVIFLKKQMLLVWLVLLKINLEK